MWVRDSTLDLPMGGSRNGLRAGRESIQDLRGQAAVSEDDARCDLDKALAMITTSCS